MKFFKATLSILVCSIMLSGCETLGIGGSDPTEEAGDGFGTAAATSGSGATTQGVGAGGVYAGDPLNDPASLLSTRIIYFTFDSSEVAADYLSIVTAHAEYLSANPGKSVVLEGHADERGSREYNIALGERRGLSVANLMKLQGVSASQIQVVSYGEEKPVDFGHDDVSWEKNRRVEIVYSGQ